MTDNTPAIEITGLVKSYGNHLAVDDINLKVERGDFFALLGPNGAGKSSVIGVISGLVRLSQGQVNVCGHDIEKHMGLARLKLGVVPQEFNFNRFEVVRDIVAQQGGFYGMLPAAAYKAADRCLAMVELTEQANIQARMLSGGMMRRLMVARALVHSPDVLILDEPTAGIDVELRHRMWEIMQQLNESGVTIILTTHYLEEAERLCRNVAFINNGKIVQQGKMLDLLNKLNVQSYRVMVDSSEVNRAQQLLAGHEIRIDESDTLCLTILDSTQILQVLKPLEQNGIDVHYLEPEGNRLEDLFMRLTYDEGAE